MASNNGTPIWRWIDGSLVALIVSNAVTFFMASTSDADIRRVVESHFTETSRNHGLYAIEGRPRLDRLEGSLAMINVKLSDIQSSLAVLKQRVGD